MKPPHAPLPRPCHGLPPQAVKEAAMSGIEQAAPLVQALERAYQHGFVTEIESDALPPGLDEDTLRAISRRKREPDFCCNGAWPRSDAGRPWSPLPGADCRWMPSTSRR